MKFSDDASQAASYLRQAIPAMVKYSIVPNPLNYTLWYSYFSHAFPELNKDLEQAIQRYGTCPPAISESLFIRHIGQMDGGNDEQLRVFQQNFSQLVENLSDSLEKTAAQTSGFSDALKSNISELEAFDLGDAVAPVLNELNANADAIQTANLSFQDQLAAARSEIASLKKELEDSQQEASTDPLTGLYNRRVFERIYEQFVETRDEEDELTLIIMDIDKFKTFNDTHGHLLGDQVLKFVGNLLLEECNENVTPVRFGGEEFAVVCPDHTLEKGTEIAEMLRTKLEAIRIKNKKTGETIPPVTASFGVACRKSKESFTDIIARADKALYQAKEAGRNRVELAV